MTCVDTVLVRMLPCASAWTARQAAAANCSGAMIYTPTHTRSFSQSPCTPSHKRSVRTRAMSTAPIRPPCACPSAANRACPAPATDPSHATAVQKRHCCVVAVASGTWSMVDGVMVVGKKRDTIKNISSQGTMWMYRSYRPCYTGWCEWQHRGRGSMVH